MGSHGPRRRSGGALQLSTATPEPGAGGERRLSGILHGRRQGRRLRTGQAALLEERLPTLALDLSGPLDPRALFGAPVEALRLEVGFGGGEHLTAQAAANPRIGFIGCEPFRNGVVGLLQQVEAQPLPNLRLHQGDAGEVIDKLDAGALARVDVLFPDPWPKRRQRKRRFVSAGMLERLARVLAPGGTLRFATDIDDYAGWTLARVLASPSFAWTAEKADDWRLPPADWVPTRYEAKARRAGRLPVYLDFRRL